MRCAAIPCHTSADIARQVRRWRELSHAFKHRRNLGRFLEPKRLNDGQRSITAARSCEPWNSLDKAIVGIREGTVDFDVFDQKKSALLHKLEERPKSGLIIPSRCEGASSSSLQERLLRSSVSTHQLIGQHAQWVVLSSRNHPCGLQHRQWSGFVVDPNILIFANRLALNSRNFTCQLLETL